MILLNRSETTVADDGHDEATEVFHSLVVVWDKHVGHHVRRDTAERVAERRHRMAEPNP